MRLALHLVKIRRRASRFTSVFSFAGGTTPKKSAFARGNPQSLLAPVQVSISYQLIDSDYRGIQ